MSRLTGFDDNGSATSASPTGEQKAPLVMSIAYVSRILLAAAGQGHDISQLENPLMPPTSSDSLTPAVIKIEEPMRAAFESLRQKIAQPVSEDTEQPWIHKHRTSYARYQKKQPTSEMTLAQYASIVEMANGRPPTQKHEQKSKVSKNWQDEAASRDPGLETEVRTQIEEEELVGVPGPSRT
ncbi:hypothetical protein LTS18_012719 [Coniosporium uncinatum]|uniref:Uncharacterized protein n=1 Tax=Coniosporium uncinatum TaxID=93489 RepID=A0ACC3DC81_9PEZI|nr:hypothetical protein LTS18_012719 [Coniosporium uncinatum]